MSGNYDDILHLPHPTSSRHPRMSMADRAAQFSPFAALTGYDEAITETGRVTQERILPGEDALAELDRKLSRLRSAGSPRLTLTYFQPDSRKHGGKYRTVAGQLKKIDEYSRCLILESGEAIRLDDILELESPELSDLPSCNMETDDV